MRKPVRRPSVCKPPRVFRTPIALAVLSVFGCAQVAYAQEPAAPEAPPTATADAGEQLDDIVVTATRRDKGLQEIPFNISAVPGDEIERQNLTDMESLARVIPGVFLLNQGARAASMVVVRGLNTSSIAASEGNGNGNGGVMATYIGDVPLYVDLKLLDMDRVEVLLGPQGTLYGAGTLGGALRYIPNRATTEESTFELDVGTSTRSQSAGVGSNLTLLANRPLSDTLAVRAVAAYHYDQGFIDYPNLVREAGVSDPEPDTPGAVIGNLRGKRDVDDEETTSARLSFGMDITPALRGDLTYHFQRQDVGGRSVNHVDSFGTGRYESGHRFVEPNLRDNELIALELNADLAIGKLTSATGFSRYDEVGQRDQTDLLLDFEYGYEDFPSFAAYTRETNEEKSFNQELRLVSPGEGRLNWIAGVFYNTFELDATSSEFVPGIPEFFNITRPDNLEYYQASFQEFTESAIFGEVGYEFTDQWQGLIGARYFDFQDDQRVGFDLPLLSGDPTAINPVFSENDIGDDDLIFKLNTSYRFNADVMGYVTISEGYRSGGVNAVPPCLNPLPPGQNVCALPNEQLIQPDKTLNHEIGVRSAWLGNRLVLNGAVFYIDWSDVQVAGTTVNGAIPITVNGAEARSQGLELTTRLRLAEQFHIRANYSYTDAELTKDAPGIVEGQDAFKGDRLPASPKHQGNLAVAYDELLPNGWGITADYGIFAISNVYSRLGLRASGEKLGGFAVHTASVGLKSGPWRTRLFVNNLFDKYAETGVRSSTAGIRTIDGDADGDAVVDHTFRLRRYYKDVLEPRTIGVTFSYDLKM